MTSLVDVGVASWFLMVRLAGYGSEEKVDGLQQGGSRRCSCGMQKASGWMVQVQLVSTSRGSGHEVSGPGDQAADSTSLETQRENTL